MDLISINPHDQSVVGKIKITTPQELKKTYKKAYQAYQTWKDTPINKRLSYVKKFRKKLKQNQSTLAKLITKEMGKPLQEALDDVTFELNYLDYYITEGPQALADQIVLQNKIGNYRTVQEPYGVVGVISPWNFPISMATSGIIPAIIAGNTVIFKPSEHTSLTQKKVIELLWETQIPNGVVNLIIGDSKVGRLLLNQPINLIWFTGSTKVGQQIYRKAGQKFIPAIMEMGGSSPALVFSDANIDQTVKELLSARFYNCGQVCSAVKRIFVEQSIFQKFTDKFVTEVEKLTIGNPMDKVDLGPLVSKKQFQTIKSQLREAVSKGAQVLTGGQAPTNPELSKGNYFQPTVVTHLDFKMRILEEETFGPLVPIMTFKTETEAIEYANKTPYGLTAEIYTKDIDKAERVAAQIQASTIGINTDQTFYPQCPFGGYKLSGMSRKYGHIGFREFTQTKTIAVAKT